MILESTPPTWPHLRAAELQVPLHHGTPTSRTSRGWIRGASDKKTQKTAPGAAQIPITSLCLHVSCVVFHMGGTNWGTEGKPLAMHSWQREGGPSGAFFMSDREEPRSSFSGTQCACALLLSEGNIAVLFSMAASAQISLGLSRAEVLHKQLPREATCSQCWLYLSCCCV